MSKTPLGTRLYTLDGLRGLAALAVALYHLDNVGLTSTRSGYLAVDFFFVLSGLVIAIAYEEKLRSGTIGVMSFVKQRVIRLYPLYVTGALFGLITVAANIPLGPFGIAAGDTLFRQVACALLMLPDPWSTYELYPLNPPAWSLFFELLINIGFAAVLVRLRNRWLLLVWLGCLISYLIKVQHAWARAPGANLGPFWDHLSAGCFRVTAAFTFGILLKRLGYWQRRRRSAIAWVPVAMLVGMFAVPPSLTSDIVFVAVVIPLTIWLASRFELPSRLQRPCELLGDLSYPLYATHFAFLFLTDRVAKALDLSPIVQAALFFAVTITVAFALISPDTRARRALSKLVAGNEGMSRRAI